MNDHRIQQRLPAILVTVLSIFFAIYAGSVIGSGQTRTLMLIAAGAGFIALGLFFRANIWILIPLFWSATGGLPFLGVPFSVKDLGILVTVTWVLIFFAVRIIRTKAKFDLLDVLLFLNLCSILFAYIRNPVGTLASGSDLIGGRPYFDTALAIAAYFVLTHAKLNEKLASRLPYIILIPTLALAAMGLVTHFFPGAGNLIAPFYSGFAAAGEDALPMAATPGMTRLTFLAGSGYLLFLFLICRYPIRSLITPLKPIRSSFFFLAVAFILLSGFRNVLISCAIASVIAPFYKRMRRDIVLIAAGATLGLGFLILAQGRFIDLPLSVQRTLSFLPGNWSEEATASAAHSTEWRFYMWKAMLEDDKYLKNPILGDGFGFSQRLFNSSLAAQDMKKEKAGQEHFLITGQVHSGPLSTIRIVGVVGLGLYLWLSIVLSIRAHRLLKQALPTPYALVTMFLTLPMIIHPVFFVFIFGSFDNDLPQIIYSLGFFKLLESSLKRYFDKKKKVEIPKRKRPEALVAPGVPRLTDLRPPLSH